MPLKSIPISGTTAKLCERFALEELFGMKADLL